MAFPTVVNSNTTSSASSASLALNMPASIVAGNLLLTISAAAVNDAATVAFLRSAALSVVGADDVVLSPQSMGGEDFGWFADRLPIALARLGTHGGGEPLDLHRGTFDVDERAIGVGVRLMARTALLALDADRRPAHT